MDLGLGGQTITHEVFDYSMSVTTEAGFEQRIENDFALGASAGLRNVSLKSPDPGSERVPSLTNSTIRSVTTDQSGILYVSFTEGHHLIVAPDPAYAAWTLAGPSGYKVVCLPGGELATWPTESR